MKIALACGAALLCAAPTHPMGDYAHDEAAIVLVDCVTSSGSAFKVGPNTYATALHVVEGPMPCNIAGQPITVTHIDRERDYATFIGPASPAILRTTCEGFKRGQMYVARGFPGGGTFNIFAPWQAVGIKLGGFSVFAASDAIPGMSGAPVIDGQGRAVGVVNKRWPARSMALRETGYCKR